MHGALRQQYPQPTHSLALPRLPVGLSCLAGPADFLGRMGLIRTGYPTNGSCRYRSPQTSHSSIMTVPFGEWVVVLCPDCTCLWYGVMSILGIPSSSTRPGATEP